MNRRTFLTTGASITLFLPFTQLRGEKIPQDNSLSGFLPSTGLVPDDFEYLGPVQGSTVRCVEGGEVRAVSEAHELDKYTLSSDPQQFQGRVQTGARLTLGERVTSEMVDDHHEVLLRDAFHGQEPSTEYFTAWCDVELSDRAVDGCRRSEFFFREPQTQQWLNEQTAAPKPYREYAVILQSTDWGVLEVEVERNDVNEQWETRRLAQRLMSNMRHTAAGSTRPADPTTQDNGEWL